MKKPFVTVICPLHPDRSRDNVMDMFNSQTYKRCNMLIAQDANNIGHKRNELVKAAKGDIIVHMDDDDIYAPDWIEKSVAFLLANPQIMITGLSSAYFSDGNERRLWEYPGSKKHVCEATMAYWRKVWSSAKCFGNTSQGEGQQFLQGNGKILPHTYIDGFEAILHGNNTSSHLSWRYMKPVNIPAAP